MTSTAGRLDPSAWDGEGDDITTPRLSLPQHWFPSPLDVASLAAGPGRALVWGREPIAWDSGACEPVNPEDL